MIPLTRHGTIEMVVGTVVLAAMAAGLWLVHPALIILPILVEIWLIAFFRDPERPLPTERDGGGVGEF